jgi:hypothetical protein
LEGFMGAIDLLWHLFNLFAVSLLFGIVAATGGRLLWRRGLAGVPMLRLAAILCGGACTVTILGLVVFGRDGRMATYGLMVLTGALTLAWLGRKAQR